MKRYLHGNSTIGINTFDLLYTWNVTKSNPTSTTLLLNVSKDASSWWNSHDNQSFRTVDKKSKHESINNLIKRALTTYDRRSLISDFTCGECQSCIKSTCQQVGKAEKIKNKTLKYELIDEIDKELKQTTSDKKSNNFLLQRISIANQCSVFFQYHSSIYGEAGRNILCNMLQKC